jgi:transglutaminase-like putative cysteine protease
MKKVLSIALPFAMALVILTFISCSMNSASEIDAPKKQFDEVKAEIRIFDGSTLEFSEKPIRAQWGLGDSPYEIAFVFPLNTIIRQRLNGELVRISAINEYRALNNIDIPEGHYKVGYFGDSEYELTLTREMGKAEIGIRIVSDYRGRYLLPVLIDGLTELAVKPGNLIIHKWEIDPNKPKPTDGATLAQLRLPSRDIQSDDPEIASLAKTITDGKNSDYEKAKVIHQWVAGNIWYNNDELHFIFDIDAERHEGENPLTSTYVLRNKRSICGGFANLTVALLRAVDIPSKGITGSAGGNAHGWTEAYVDARWINMDTTWDCKNIYENGKFSSKQSPGNKWFDVADNEFSKTHKITSYAEYILENGLAAE